MPNPFVCPKERREGLEKIKRAVNINHDYLDNWIYLFYENKKFNIQETIEKLNRRDIMEKTVYSTYTITPGLKKSMRSGIVQFIGRDREGRPILYFNSARDFPKVEEREERRANLDMFLSWAVRADPENPTSTTTWLINQKDSSFRKNTDLLFQKEMAIRISKFFPGCIGRLHLCNMGSTLTFVMNPLLRQLPSAISSVIFMFSSADLQKGKLFEHISEDVLPVALGGKNDCDNKDNYEYFATSVEHYFDRTVKALRQGISIKEMEMMEAYDVDQQGNPRSRSPNAAHNQVESMEGAMLEERSKSVRSGSHVHIEKRGQEMIEVSLTGANSGQKESEGSYRSDDAGNSTGSVPGDVTAVFAKPVELPVPDFNAALRTYPFDSLALANPAHRQNVVDLMEAFCQEGMELSSITQRLMLALRSRQVPPSEFTALKQKADLIERVAHTMMFIFPSSSVKLHYPIFAWLAEPPPSAVKMRLHEDRAASLLSVEWWEEAGRIDCTSPDNFLLSLQSSAIDYIDDCDTILQESKAASTVLKRISNFWSSNLTYKEVEHLIEERYHAAWKRLVPYFHQYVECKVSLSIAEFIRHHGLLVSGGKLDHSAGWYKKLVGSMVEYREMRRKNYLFYLFPPLFRQENESGGITSPPSAEELLQLQNLSVSFQNVIRVVCLIERSFHNTLDQLASPVTVNVASKDAVERYLEDTKSKIYITYESQREGLFPQEVAAEKQSEAFQCLEAAQAPLTDFLFCLASLTLLKEKAEKLSRQPYSIVENVLKEQLNESEERIAFREQSRLFANGLAAVACEMQGSFTYSAFHKNTCSDSAPHSYIVSLSLLFILAAIYQSPEAVSSSPPLSSEEVTNNEKNKFFADEFLCSITKVHKSAASILNQTIQTI